MREIETVTVAFEGRSYLLDTFKGDHITKALKTGRFYEEHLLRAIRDLHLDGTFVDCGAHIGTLAAFFRAECGAHVIAVEPNATVWPLLHTNLLRAPGLTPDIHHVAVHDVLLGVDMVESDVNTGNTHAVKGTGAPVVSLDTVCGEETIALVKMDIQGCEPAALRSGMTMLQRDRPVLAIEMARVDAEVTAILKPLGYTRGPGFGPKCSRTFLWMP